MIRLGYQDTICRLVSCLDVMCMAWLIRLNRHAQQDLHMHLRLCTRGLSQQVRFVLEQLHMRRGLHLLVAPMMKTWEGTPMFSPDPWGATGVPPSSSASSWATTRSMTPPESAPAPRAGARESSSSKKSTHGEASLARAKTSRTCARSASSLIIWHGMLTNVQISGHQSMQGFWACSAMWLPMSTQ